jgi:peptidoglycan-associated lipoprotein
MRKILFALMVVAAALVGCKSDPEIKDPAPIGTLDGTGTKTDTGTRDTRMDGDPLTNPNHKDYVILQKRSIFFDYDSDAIKAEYVPVVEAHARYLVSRPERKVLVQGHADDRGSREYNLALGQRRADAIKSRLSLLGAKPAQVEAVSLGEEKPACSEPSENCYGQNRRGDLVYN